MQNFENLKDSDFKLIASMPPKDYDKPFIRYVVNSDLIPSFYNGTKLVNSEKIAVRDIPGLENFQSFADSDQRLVVKAVTCRYIWADSEVAVREFTKTKGIREGAKNIIT